MGPSRRQAALALLLALAAAALLSHPAEAGADQRRRHPRHHHPRGGAAAVCRHTDYPALCMAAARAARGPPGAPAAIAEATIEAALRKAHQARAEVERLRGRLARGGMETCRQSYESALADLQASARALRAGVMADLQINLSAVISDVGTCDDGLTTGAGGRSPLAGISEVIHRFASNGLALSDLIKPHH